jgi:hypothetical protein
LYFKWTRTVIKGPELSLLPGNTLSWRLRRQGVNCYSPIDKKLLTSSSISKFAMRLYVFSFLQEMNSFYFRSIFL